MEITVHDVKQMLATDKSPLLLDCREDHEWQTCRIEGAVHIPMAQTPARLDELPADQPIVVYCHHGVRSLRVTQFLIQSGRDARSMSGGIDAWSLQIDPSVPRY